MARRSPLKETPLRAAGQSLDEHRVNLVLDKVLFPSMVAVTLIGFWLYDLVRSYRDVPPMPWLTGAIAFAGVAYAAWRVRTTMPAIRRLRLARDGERSVAQGLEQLGAAGYAAYHDIQGDDFNVDHVLIGPAGVFTIETKTWSKPAHGKANILVESDSISVEGWRPGRDPAPQARAQAAWIAEILRKSTGRVFPVNPVIVFPGWWVELKEKPMGLWVINDKALPAFLAKERERMTNEDISMAKSHLEAFVRSQAQYR